MPEPKASSLPINLNDIVAAALNEHGFLLQQVVRNKLGGWITDSPNTQGEDKWKDLWHFVAAEYPVTAADGSQTRIDLLLRHKHHPGVHICMECKRPNPKFKKWIFFDRESNVAGMQDWQMTVETLFVGERPADPQGVRRSLVRLPYIQDVSLFAYYVEAGVKRDGSSSSTEAIEKAFYQLMKGHSGLMAKLVSSNDNKFLRSIPLVVTTAELVEAKFDPKQVSIENGMIAAADLQLAPMDWCAVNYRADDNLALPGLTPQERSVGLNDLINSQIRTVFVVRALAINKFLNWASCNLLNSA
jgi:hypothetical protein